MKKLEHEDKIKSIEHARAHTTTTARTSKVRRTSEWRMKNPKKKKDLAKVCEFD